LIAFKLDVRIRVAAGIACTAHLVAIDLAFIVQSTLRGVLLNARD
jgi:hypothetical protein